MRAAALISGAAALAALALALAPRMGPTTTEATAEAAPPSACISRANFRREARRVMRSPRPLTRRRGAKVHRLIRCARPASRSLMRRYVAKLRRWRRSYPVKWKLALARRPPSWRAWAWATDGCESTHGAGDYNDSWAAFSAGTGFRGRLQWIRSTWLAAGGTGDPAVASYEHEAVLGIDWARTHGKGHWPVCGY